MATSNCLVEISLGVSFVFFTPRAAGACIHAQRWCGRYGTSCSERTYVRTPYCWWQARRSSGWWGGSGRHRSLSSAFRDLWFIHATSSGTWLDGACHYSRAAMRRAKVPVPKYPYQLPRTRCIWQHCGVRTCKANDSMTTEYRVSSTVPHVLRAPYLAVMSPPPSPPTMYVLY